ncbi:glycosyltransferase family 2 protein [Tautonia sociabilis]|nr:glycosyltransferase [Tautonia sociabilis]
MPTPLPTTTSTPPVTVALPTYNGARHLADALRGILAQEGVPFDLLVCDDRSDDETVSLVRSLAGDRARIEINPERLGLAGNWNRCAALARTPLLAIVHQDDILLPGHLAAHVDAFARLPGLGMAISAVEVIDAADRPIPPTVIERPDLGPAERLFPPPAFVAELAHRNPVRCSAVTLRAEALASIGGFDPSYRYAVDWECWLRLARRWPVCWLPLPSVAVRWHPDSETHRFKRGSADLDELALLLDQIHTLDRPSLPHPSRSRRLAHRLLGRAFLNRSLDALHAGDAPLALRCLRRSLSLSPALLLLLARDPRLAAQMTALSLAPRWASRRFRHPDQPGQADSVPTSGPA